jgi:hypothetical protein
MWLFTENVIFSVLFAVNVKERHTFEIQTPKQTFWELLVFISYPYNLDI